MINEKMAICRILIISAIWLVFSGNIEAQTQNKYLKMPIPQTWDNDTLFLQQNPVDNTWWKSFNDAQLDSLIKVAMSNNNSLLVTADRIRMAKASYRIQQGNFYPNLDLSAGWQKQQNSRNTTRQEIPGLETQSQYASAELSTSWQIDLFGSIRNRVKSQKELYKASLDDYNGVMVSLCAQVASSYGMLRSLQQELLVAQKNIASQQAILHITEVRYNTGLASQLDVSQAKSVYFSTRATLPMIETSIRQQINTLAVLLGVYPDELRSALQSVKPIPDYTRIVGIGIPTNLLRQRPDIRSAERAIASNAAALGASKSDFFPKFYLKGSIGFAARDMDRFFNHNSLVYQISPTMNWTLFQGTQLTQSYKLAKAQLDESIQQYNQTVLVAVQEVDNSMTGYLGYIQQIGALQELVYQGELTLKLSLDLYKRGLSNFQNVLDAQRSLLDYQNSLVSAQGNALDALIQLYQSVGGGWVNE